MHLGYRTARLSKVEDEADKGGVIRVVWQGRVLAVLDPENVTFAAFTCRFASSSMPGEMSSVKRCPPYVPASGV